MFLLLLLPFSIVSDESNDKADASFSPISSSSLGGLGKVWEQEWTYQTDFVTHSNFFVMGNYIYVVGTITKDYEDHFFFIKFDQNGSIVWEKVDDQEEQAGIDVWGDGSNLYTLHSELGDAFITKWLPDGTAIWVQFVEERISHSLEGKGGSLYLLTSSYGNSYVSKWYFNGTMDWEISGPSGVDCSFTTNNDSIYVFCNKKSYLNEEVYFNKYALNGTMVWQKVYTGEELYEKSIWADDDYVYMIGSNCSSSPDSLLLVKFYQNGSIVWETSFQCLGDKTKGLSVIAPSPEEIYVGGGTTYPGRFLLAGFNEDGNLLWSKTWEEDLYGEYSIVGIQEYDDGVYTLGEDEKAFILTKWVQDTIPPTLIGLEDVQCEQLDSMFSLNWYAYDENPGFYSISRNNSIISSGNWFSGEAIGIQIDRSSPLGLYNYTIVVMDLSGSLATDSLVINIEDTISPKVSGSYSNESNEIVWVAEDRNPASYVVYKDGEVIASGDWISEGAISVITVPEKRNSLNYTIIVRDTSGNSCSDSMIIPALLGGGTNIVFPFSWLEVLLVLVGMAFIATIVILAVFLKKNHLVIKEKVYIEN